MQVARRADVTRSGHTYTQAAVDNWNYACTRGVLWAPVRSERASEEDRGCRAAAAGRVCRHVMDVIDVRSTPRRNWIYVFVLFSRCRWMRLLSREEREKRASGERACAQNAARGQRNRRSSCAHSAHHTKFISFICVNNKRLFVRPA